MVVCFFGKTGHVATVPLEQRWTVHSEYTTISLEFSHIGSNQFLFDRPKRRMTFYFRTSRKYGVVNDLIILDMYVEWAPTKIVLRQK